MYIKYLDTHVYKINTFTHTQSVLKEFVKFEEF